MNVSFGKLPRGNARKCGDIQGVFSDISLADDGSPLQIQALRNVYEGRAAAPGNEAAGDNGAVFSPLFSSNTGYPQKNTTFGDKVWVSSYILCISVFRVLTDEGKAYYI